MSKRRIIATITFVLGFLIAGWLWAEDHHLAAAGVLLISAAWNLFIAGPSRQEAKELELLRDVPNPDPEEVKRYREAHPGTSMHEAIAMLKHEQNPPERTSASRMSSMSTLPHHEPAAHYAHGHQPSVLASHATRSAQNSCAYFLDRVQPGQRILDLGCGPGSITLDLASMVGDEGLVVGVDFSSEAITRAQREASDRGDKNTLFMVGDLFDLDVEPNSFDIVHAHQVLQHVADPIGALRAMARYVKPGGFIAARDADYGAMAWYPPMEGIEQWRSAYCASARALGGEPDAGRRLRAWAQEAGLRVCLAESSTWTYATPDTTKWWGNSQADRVMTSSFADRAAGQGLSPQQINKIAEHWRQWGQHPDAWFLLPHGEIIAVPNNA